MLAGFFNMMPRWVNGLGMKYNAEEIMGSSDYLTNQGYGPNDTSGLNDEDYMETTFEMNDQNRVEIAGG